MSRRQGPYSSSLMIPSPKFHSGRYHGRKDEIQVPGPLLLCLVPGPLTSPSGVTRQLTARFPALLRFRPQIRGLSTGFRCSLSNLQTNSPNIQRGGQVRYLKAKLRTRKGTSAPGRRIVLCRVPSGLLSPLVRYLDKCSTVDE